MGSTGLSRADEDVLIEGGLGLFQGACWGRCPGTLNQMIEPPTRQQTTIQLRPYQRRAVDSVKEAFDSGERFALLQAATGAGKTIIFSTLVRELIESTPFLRIAILAHRRELVAQAQEKLQAVWPQAPIGIACSSLQSRRELRQPITIGTIQTLARQSRLAPFNVIIVDEVHRLPVKDSDTQFGTFIVELLERNPALCLLGVTATPYRLGHGYIFGKHCETPWANWFSRLNACIGIDTLQKEGFLCPYRHLVADGELHDELESMQRPSDGDFPLPSLQKVVTRPRHLESAIHTIHQHATDREAIVIFCVSIEHARLMEEALLEVDIPSASVHSEMSTSERDDILEDFAEGRLRVLTNVNVLTEGWDAPRTDCVVLCRPTLSTALYVQMVGRGLRIHPNKQDCLVLDLAGCFQRHGSVKAPMVRFAGQAPPSHSESNTRLCPHCLEVIPLSGFTCPHCMADLKPEVQYLEEEVEMVHAVERLDHLIFCEICGRHFPKVECVPEWMGFDHDAHTPGILYCPEEHPVGPLEPPRELSAAGNYELLNFRSRLNLAGGDVQLDLALFLSDENHQAFTTRAAFPADEEGLERLADYLGGMGLEVETFSDPYSLPSLLNRQSLPTPATITFSETKRGLWPLSGKGPAQSKLPPPNPSPS